MNGRRRKEGWLYVYGSFIHSYYRRHSVHKRYFVVEDGRAMCFSSKPSAKSQEVPIRDGRLSHYMRIEEQGREAIRGRALYVFRIYDPTDHARQLKLGAKSPDEAAAWIQAFREASNQASNDDAEEFIALHEKKAFKKRPARSSLALLSAHGSSDADLDQLGTAKPVVMCQAPAGLQDPSSVMVAWSGVQPGKREIPVVSSSNWKIKECRNGLRIFKELTEGQPKGKWWQRQPSPPPVLMAVGVVEASCEQVFDAVMSLGPSRGEWDVFFAKGRVLEHVDGHTDIIHKTYRHDCFPGRMLPRDVVLTRFWRREEDGTYVVLYRSTRHDRCPKKKGYRRATVGSGGFVVSPIRDGRPGQPARSVVRSMLEIHWGGWLMSTRLPLGKKLTHVMLNRVAALREMFASREPKLEAWDRIWTSCEPRNGQPDRPRLLPMPPPDKSLAPEIGKEPLASSASRVAAPMGSSATEDGGAGPKAAVSDSFLDPGEDDEFFDAREETTWQAREAQDAADKAEVEGEESDSDADDGLAAMCLPLPFLKHPSGRKSRKEAGPMACFTPRPSSPPRVPKDEGLSAGQRFSRSVEGLSSVPEGPVSLDAKHSWACPPGSLFLIRSASYLIDKKKESGGPPLMHLVGMDWFRSKVRQDHLAARPGCLVQKASDFSPFFCVINLQVPGRECYSLCLYYALLQPLEQWPLLHRFVNDTDAFRNSRFKLIPNIAQGGWLVRNAVGQRACLVGEALRITYHRGPSYLELDIDIGSSSVANGVVGLVLGYLSKLTVDMAFLIQADTEEELPEHLLGTVRLSRLEVGKAVPPVPAVL
ncbi:hypothetical protein KFL_006870070 [Klebsormidium nitens]|uniref:START domain-containing protein n=1 Tax=Klebsormidium nitens TaxID=105231 RepID=A0A1Y1IPX6_KLENI|nr:hypothetical protein KFL_006870070 [Klebsormidium nitens]|eukprot:GAQ90806.1 hypothetical protein KFL_006870070 [Klebsormidium nitens]